MPLSTSIGTKAPDGHSLHVSKTCQWIPCFPRLQGWVFPLWLSLSLSFFVQWWKNPNCWSFEESRSFLFPAILKLAKSSLQSGKLKLKCIVLWRNAWENQNCQNSWAKFFLTRSLFLPCNQNISFLAKVVIFYCTNYSFLPLKFFRFSYLWIVYSYFLLWAYFCFYHFFFFSSFFKPVKILIPFENGNNWRYSRSCIFFLFTDSLLTFIIPVRLSSNDLETQKNKSGKIKIWNLKVTNSHCIWSFWWNWRQPWTAAEETL